MKRRTFIAALGSAAAWPVAARAQQTRTPTIGYIGVGPRESPAAGSWRQQFLQALREMGFIEGRNLAMEYAWADNRNDQLPGIAAEFVRRGVDIIVVTTTASLLAAKAATQTIPIVFQIGSDPVEIGLVASLGRPGGNMTGVYNLQLAVTAKRLELLHEVVPAATSIAYLRNPTNPVFAEAEAKELQTAARVLGVRVVPVSASNSGEFSAAFATLVGERSTALLVSSDALFANYPDSLVAFASRYEIPTMYDRREFTIAGGLLSYGADVRDIFHSLGIYAGRLLKGDNPADLPVQQSTKVEFIINLKAAKALGVTVPLPLLGRADEVIE